MSHPPYHTFRETLAMKYPDCGQALWDPSPGGSYDAVQVGDVGFIRNGRFHRLFNVFLPGDHTSHQNFGVPELHQPLVLNAQNLYHKGTEGTKDFHSRHVSLSRECQLYASGPDDDSQVTVLCPGKRGAALSLPVPAQREDTIAVGDFGRWMVKYIDQWFAFAENLGLGIRMQDIILVTGCHRAKSWVNVVFSEGLRDAEVSFGVQLSGASNVKIEQRRAHGDVALKLGPNGENLPENQCIFIRGFRVVRILNIWPVLRGQAEPALDQAGHEPEPYEQLETICSSDDQDINYEDPLHVLLQYIAESALGCDSDMALVHDDDLAYIIGASLDNLQPDAVMEYLRGSVRGIQQIQCDAFPGNSSGAGAAAKVQVAILSRDEFPSGAQAVGMLSNVPSTDNAIMIYYNLKRDNARILVLAGLWSGITTAFLVNSRDSSVHRRLYSISVTLSTACVASVILHERILHAASDFVHTRLFSGLGIEYISSVVAATPVTLLYLSIFFFLVAEAPSLHMTVDDMAVVFVSVSLVVFLMGQAPFFPRIIGYWITRPSIKRTRLSPTSSSGIQ